MKKKNTVITKYFIFFILCFFIIVFFYYYTNTPNSVKKNLEQFALGNKIFPDTPFLNKRKIICNQDIDLKDKTTEIKKCLNFIQFKNNKNVIWLGNSQLYSINQKKIKERSSPILVANELFKKKINLKSFGYPNLNLKEVLMLLKFIKNEISIDMLVIPIFFDDMRESNIRNEILELSNKKSKTVSTKSLQDIFENYITTKLQECCNWISALKDSQGGIEVFLYKLRNFIFNIKPTSTRRVLVSSYNENIKSLKEILKISKERNIKVLAYIPPIRNDLKLPYNLKDYTLFKKEILNIFNNYSFKLLNLENKVPNQYWGLKESTDFSGKEEYDFMHFQYKGHKILSNIIVKNILNDF